MDKYSRSDKKQVSLKKDKSESLVSNENEVTISREYVVNEGRGQGIAHQLKYLEEAREIVLSFEEIKEYAVFVFGSRADGSAHQRSDIDIGVLGKQALPAIIKLSIEEKLEESNIPLRVEVIDFYNADQAFKNQAFKNRIVWNLPKDIELD